MKRVLQARWSHFAPGLDVTDSQEWVKDIPEAGPSKSPNSKIDPAKASQAASKLTAERLAALRKKWVRVPADPIKAAKPCPVCKESFKSEWAEDDEEWVYRNAVDVNGNVSVFFRSILLRLQCIHWIVLPLCFPKPISIS